MKNVVKKEPEEEETCGSCAVSVMERWLQGCFNPPVFGWAEGGERVVARHEETLATTTGSSTQEKAESVRDGGERQTRYGAGKLQGAQKQTGSKQSGSQEQIKPTAADHNRPSFPGVTLWTRAWHGDFPQARR